MKRALITSIAVLFLGLTGCFLFEPFDAVDTIVNATTERCSVSADFMGGAHKVYELVAEQDQKFGRRSRKEAIPVLSSISFTSTAANGVNFAFGVAEVRTLRERRGGRLVLVLYESGVACIPPDCVAPEGGGYPGYLQWLRAHKYEWLAWTKGVLEQKGVGRN